MAFEQFIYSILKKNIVFILVLFLVPDICSAQFNIYSISNFGEYGKENESQYFPQIITKEQASSLKIGSVKVVKYKKGENQNFRISEYANFGFDDLGRIISYYSIDSIRESNAFFFKKSWIIDLNQSFAFYTGHAFSDSIISIEFFNLPYEFKGNMILKERTVGGVYESMISDEVFRREFKTRLSPFLQKVPRNLGYSQLIGRIRKDTIGFSKFDFRENHIIPFDTPIRPGNPTLVLSKDARVIKKFPYFSSSNLKAKKPLYIEYFYNKDGQLIAENFVNYRFEFSTYYFYNKEGLISAIWEKKNNGLHLNSVFFWEFN